MVADEWKICQQLKSEGMLSCTGALLNASYQGGLWFAEREILVEEMTTSRPLRRIRTRWVATRARVAACVGMCVRLDSWDMLYATRGGHRG